MKPHKCEKDKNCSCSIAGLEPDEECPVHGGCYVKPRCIYCGRFLKENTGWLRKVLDDAKESYSQQPDWAKNI